MTVILTSLLASLCCAVVPTGTQLITSPPKLESESMRIVWYQIPGSGDGHKFELKCHASGDPEKYQWLKNGQNFSVDDRRVKWQRPGQSGNIDFHDPQVSDQGFYQCKAINIFGTAVSNIFEVKLGSLEHFSQKSVRNINIAQGSPLTLSCKPPFGIPPPSVLWLFRNTKQTFVIETIDRPHITVDGNGSLQFSYVEMHEGRENLVYQCAASSPVLHGEYRAGDEYRLIVKEAAMVTRPPKELWFTPRDVNVTAGETLKLMCIFSGYPLPTIIWLKKGGELPVERLSHENFGKTLVIKPVLHHDDGVYICKVDDIEHEMVVKVTSAPQWVDAPPEDFDLPEEADVELKCRAMGDPSPVVRWYKNGIPIESNSLTASDDRRTIIDDGQSLRITDLKHNIDRAVYQCNASNNLGYMFANAYINVRAHAPQFDTPTNQTIKVTEGSSINLDCSVRAAPLPKVKWLIDGNREFKSVEGKYDFLPNHTLRISNARFADAHNYFCDVENKFGLNKARRVLEVYKPTILVHHLRPKDKKLEAGDEFELSCVAESDERLSIKYIWMKNDHPIDFAIETSVIKTATPNRIRMVNLRGKNSGTYKCKAQTDVDEVSDEMKLIVKDVPESPIITSIQCTQSQALISWTPAFHNFDRINEYFVEYSTEFHPNDWKIGVTVANMDQNTFEAAVNLSPWVTFSFKVVAANSYGRGNAAHNSMKCSTNPSVPYDDPKNVSAMGTQKDNLVIRWKPLEKELWNAPGLFYIVRYRLAETLSPGDNVSWTERRIEDPFLNFTVIKELPSYRKFLVQVKAQNNIGLSLDRDVTVEGYSGEDVPAVAPKNFAATQVNATSVKFVWDAVDAKLVNGRLKGYKIKAWSISKKQKRWVRNEWDISVSPFQTFAILTAFEPMQKYAAQVLVFNNHFDGPPSADIEFSTPEGPPGPVTNLVVESYGAYTILTKWTAPTDLKGRLRIYHVQYREDGPNDKDKNVYDTVVTVDYNHHMQESLQSDTNYTVSVWAETGGGAGPRLSQQIRTYRLENPAKPNFTIQPLDPKTATISWIPSKIGMPGTSFHLNYSRTDSKEWTKSPTIFLPEIKITIGNLIPEADYKIILYVKDGERSTMSDMKHFRTVNRTMSEQTRHVEVENLTGAAWFIAVVCALAVAILTVVVVCVCRINKGGKYPVKKKELERGHHLDKDEERSFMEYQYGSGSSDLNNT